ncbi:hypothetical protein SKAU_G00299220 [Synaphobranchus kaupii]|uniref:Uncharacterized protein n=1 Tax=Synaphobranchus kaupii TaxID=118154 RepID=A0A9Q1EVC4_SYNKA|nr:hypothetical protein SKAU_G00299220 [Synaphobranchus kaupii]
MLPNRLPAGTNLPLSPGDTGALQEKHQEQLENSIPGFTKENSADSNCDSSFRKTGRTLQISSSDVCHHDRLAEKKNFGPDS